jgi:RNA polymerase sigma-70 factor, ECF subfamily
MRNRGDTSALSRSAGDASAFEDFYREHATALLGFFVRRTLDPHVALELVAETFATAFQRRRQFRGQTDGQAAAWLYRIAANQHNRYVRRGRVHQRAIHRLTIAPPSYTDEDLARVEELAKVDAMRSTIRTGFDELPEAQRRALALRVVQEMPYPEVARRLGVSEQTARARVSRGLRHLQAAVAASHEENPT